MTDDNILSWAVESNYGTSPEKFLRRLGAPCINVAQVETRMSAMVRCPACKSEAIEVSAVVNGEAKVLTMSGIPCPRCEETITIQWDAQLTFDEAGNGKCGGAEIAP